MPPEFNFVLNQFYSRRFIYFSIVYRDCIGHFSLTNHSIKQNTDLTERHHVYENFSSTPAYRSSTVVKLRRTTDGSRPALQGCCSCDLNAFWRVSVVRSLIISFWCCLQHYRSIPIHSDLERWVLRLSAVHGLRHSCLIESAMFDSYEFVRNVLDQGNKKLTYQWFILIIELLRFNMTIITCGQLRLGIQHNHCEWLSAY